MKMHEDEVDVDAGHVRALVAAEFPHWADLEVVTVRSTGTVNAIFRLGDDLSVRLPRHARWSGDLDKELRWLPALAPQLPLRIPEPVAAGSPGLGYPFRWAVYRWLEGDTYASRSRGRRVDRGRGARRLRRAPARYRSVGCTGLDPRPPARGAATRRPELRSGRSPARSTPVR